MHSFYVTDQEVLHGGSTGRTVVVAAGGEVDYAASPKLREVLERATQTEGTAVIVDLSQATFIDSTAIGVLIGAASKLGELGPEMAIVCADPPILNVFAVVGLGDLVDICASREQALGALAAHT